eukprot:824072-Amphidinium_carterae.1
MICLFGRCLYGLTQLATTFGYDVWRGVLTRMSQEAMHHHHTRGRPHFCLDLDGCNASENCSGCYPTLRKYQMFVLIFWGASSTAQHNVIRRR